MKVGDKVRVNMLEEVDEKETSLKIGDIGVITDTGPYNDGVDGWDIFYLKFYDTNVIQKNAINSAINGTYVMCREQLEVIN